MNTPMHELKAKLAAITRYLPPARPVVYLDYPVHLNFGDILIMRGTERFFADYGYRVIERTGYMNFTAARRRAVPANAVIVLHGGGNFGDLYPVHQHFREAVVRQFPEHPIVLMPQTVHFQSERARELSAAIFRQHRNLVLMVRDQRSLAAVADQFSPQVVLMPDMAHQLWDDAPPSAAGEAAGRVELWRADIEATAPPGAAGGAVDWLDFVPVWQRRLFGLILRLHRLEGKTDLRLGAQQAWYAYCEALTGRMQAQFAAYGEVRTNRLHGMIFAALLGKRVVFDDNSYGKLGHYAGQWFDQHPGIRAG
jgi:pyruvyl transferase EpsO